MRDATNFINGIVVSFKTMLHKHNIVTKLQQDCGKIATIFSKNARFLECIYHLQDANIGNKSIDGIFQGGVFIFFS